jgi:hypothetical protein
MIEMAAPAEQSESPGRTAEKKSAKKPAARRKRAKV